MEREERITDIQGMLEKMSDIQVENVHVYAKDELEEPNHEAVALQVIMELSRKYGKAK